MIPLIRPRDHHHARNLHGPIVEYFVVGRPVVRFDAVVERLIRTRWCYDAMRHRREISSVLNSLAISFPDEPIVVFNHIIHIVGIAVRRAHQAHERFVPAEPLTDHVHVDVAERLLHQLFIRLHPGACTRELRPPKKSDRPLRSRNASLSDERVERSRDFRDRRAA